MYQIRTFLMRYRVVLIAVLALVSVSIKPSMAQGRDEPGAVYVLSNQNPDSVLVYARAANGTLSFSGSFLTGGTGAGTGVDPLGSQGSIVLGQGNRFLLAVNAGSNDVSAFAVDATGLHLRLLDREPSGGTQPVSVAVNGNVVYTVNGSGTIQGFTFDPVSGHLSAIPGSLQSLPGGASAGPGQIGISPDGAVLIVTEKSTNQLDTWQINGQGVAVNGTTISSGAGTVPFGFTFIQPGVSLVTDAGLSALASYQVNDDGTLDLITGAVPDGGKANCWVVVTKNGRYAYVSNTGSGNVSSYTIARDGSVSLLNTAAAGSLIAPIDAALSENGHFFFIREGTTGTMAGFRVESDGSLTPIGTIGGLPAGAQGLAAQ
jgi:6-phosphogluconolactonase (cycloisomerase 2 family)